MAAEADQLGPRAGRGLSVAAVAIASTVALLALFVWDNWVLNFDGSGYLALAASLADFEGYRFPDGSAVTFRGPGFPLLLAAGQLVIGEGVKSAIWIARAALVVNAGLVAAIVLHYTRSAPGAAVGGIAAAVQPWAFVAGATVLVPDAFAASFVLAAYAVLATRHPRSLLAAGLLLGAGFVTKETALLGLLAAVPIVVGDGLSLRRVTRLLTGFALPVLAWTVYSLVVARRLPEPLPDTSAVVAWVMLSAVTLVVVAASVVTARSAGERTLATPGVFWLIAALVPVTYLLFVPLLGSTLDLVGALDAVSDRLLQEMYRDSPWLLAAVAVAVLAGWASTRRSAVAGAGLSLLAVGIAAAVAVAGAGFALRNAVVGAYGASILAGALTAAAVRADRQAFRLGAAVVVGAFIVTAATATAGTDSRAFDRLVTDDNPAVMEAASWLDANAARGSVATTPLFASALAVATEADIDFVLLPLHISSTTSWPQAMQREVNWLGTRAAADDGPIEPISVTATEHRIAAHDVGAVFAALRVSDHVVVTGNARFNASPFDGGVLIPMLEAAPWASRVFRSDDVRAQWVVIYAVDAEPRPVDVPTVFRSTTGAPIRGLETLSTPQYEELVRSLLEVQ